MSAVPPPGLVGATAVEDVAAAFAATVKEAFARRGGPFFSLVLSGGPTAEDCYERMAELPPGAIDWRAVDVYVGDERAVAPDDADANQRMIRQALIDPVGGVHRFFPMPTEGPLPECARRYDELVHTVVDVDDFDLVHLGLGPDGHTASLFPGSSGLEAPDDVYVVANTDPSGRNPHPRLTLTLAGIARARLCVFTVTGASKAPVVQQLREGRDLPAARVRAGEVRWLLDAGAMGPAASQ